MANVRNFTKKQAFCLFSFIVFIILILYGAAEHEPSVPSYNSHFFDKFSDRNLFSYRSNPKDIEKVRGDKKDIPTPTPYNESVVTASKGIDEKSNALKMKEKFKEKMTYLFLHMT